MLRIILILNLVLTHVFAISQPLPGNFNLVPNPGFELIPRNLFSILPGCCSFYGLSDTSFTNNPVCWINANKGNVSFRTFAAATLGTTTPIPHSGAFNMLLAPNYTFGYEVSTQQIVDTNQLGGQARSYAETKLYQPLVHGETYTFSVFVGYLNDSGNQSHFYSFIIGNIGVYFSKSKLSDYTTNHRINVTPQIRFTNWPTPVNGTFSYTKLTASYVAQGGEQFMTIGNFDYFDQFKLLAIDTSNSLDTIYASNIRQCVLDDVSLVKDTTQSSISLTEFSLGPDTTICEGALIGGQPNFLHYWWNTGDTTRLIPVLTAGKYWCTVDYGCSTFTDTIQVTIKPAPQAFHIADTALCANTQYVATAPIAPKGDIYQYNWSNSSNSRTTSFTTPGKKWVSVTNLCGLSYTDSFRLVNTPATIPGININTNPPIILCDGTPTTFVTNNVSAGLTPTYKWYKNGALIQGANNASYRDSLLVNGDTLIVAMYSTAGCPVTQPTFSNHVGVTVYPNLITNAVIAANPGTIISSGQPVTFTATPVNGGLNPEYLWFLNGVPIANNTSDTWTAYNLKDGDVVNVRMESKVHCPTPPLVFSNSLTIHTAATNVVHVGNVSASIYPNPATQVVFIDLTDGTWLNAQCAIYDSYGRVVIAATNIISAHQKVDVQTLPAGIYFYALEVDGAVYHGKFVKQ